MADILIRGMELPEDCEDYINIRIYGNGNIVCKPIVGHWYQRENCCISIPSHGKLVDVNELKKLAYEIKTNRGTYQTVINIVDLLNAHPIVPAEGGGEDG